MIELQNIRSFIGRTFTITYNSSEIGVVDLNKMTFPKETATGYIEDTGITIIRNTPGTINFTINENVQDGKAWFGTVNIIEFQSRVNGPVTLNCKVE